MMPLRDLYAEHSGKVSDKWSLYIEAYDRYFGSVRNMEVNILEIGAQNGGSLEIWLKYFPNARTVTGVDINPACATLKFDDPRIRLIVGDANDVDTASRILDGVSSPFDIIIDDGSHRSSDVVKSFALYFPKLALGGIYIMEDMHCGYWSEFEGGLYSPLSAVSFAKRLADLPNFEHWRDGMSRTRFLQAFDSTYGASFDENSLQEVDSVEFSNSLIAIHKKRWQTEGLGRRNVAGQISEVVDAQQLSTQTQSQLKGPASAEVVHGPIELAFEQLRNELAALRAQHRGAGDELKALGIELRETHATLADTDAKLASTRQRINAIEGSISWRITAPLRALTNNFRGDK